MFSSQFTVVLLMATALILAACGKDKKADAKSSTEIYQEKYQFRLNGCDTLVHEFQSNSVTDLEKQLCEALQDEKLNRFCAQPFRRSHFEKKCSGYSWNPVYPQAPARPSARANQPYQPPHSQPIEDDRDYAKEDQIRRSLENLLVESYTIHDGLSPKVAQVANELTGDMKICGFSYIGPKCQNYVPYNGSYLKTFIAPDGESIFMSDLTVYDMQTSFLLAFVVNETNGFTVDELKVYIKISERKSGQSIKDYLADSTATQQISSVRIAKDFISTAKSRVQQPSSLKELYYMTDQLSDLGNVKHDVTLNSFLVEQIKKNKRLLSSQMEDQNYQMRVYMLAKNLGASKLVLIELAEELLKSRDYEIKSFAAVQILLIDTSRSDVKPLVLEAMSNSSWPVKKDAIIALGSANPTIDEQIQIITKIDYYMNTVREVAAKTAGQFKLSDKHLDALISLSKSESWLARRDSVILLSKIPGTKVTNHLIGMMSDSLRSVRDEVNSQLAKRIVGADSITSLATQLSDSNWVVRRDSALLLGKIKDINATKILIQRMDDSYSAVREVIFELLNQTQMQENYLENLNKHRKSTNWTVRTNVASLIAKIKSVKAQQALVDMIPDQMSNVREHVFNILNTQTLSSELIPSLKRHLTSDNWTVRRDVIKLLGKINSRESLNVLLDQLTIENFSEVKAQLAKSIEAIRKNKN